MVVKANWSVMVDSPAKRLGRSATKTAASETAPRKRKEASSKRRNWAASAPQLSAICGAVVR
jgi:hypothetical protein